MRPFHLALLLPFACGDSGNSDTGAGGETDTDTDTDSDTDSDTDTDPGSCTALTEGGWEADGTCIGMMMTATLTLETGGCTFTLSDWDMMMDVPAGGVVTGSDVTLTGDGWEDCTGTTDGTSITGTCGGGCSFSMSSSG